jgi:hypothetical protein
MDNCIVEGTLTVPTGYFSKSVSFYWLTQKQPYLLQACPTTHKPPIDYSETVYTPSDQN